LDKKKIIEFLGAIFVAAIFITSYASFGTRTSQGQKTTTTAINNAFYSRATVAAAITGYGPALTINVSCSNASKVYEQVNNILLNYEKNGSVNTYFSQGSNQFQIESGTLSSYAIYLSMKQGLGSNATCIVANPTFFVQLPSTVVFYNTVLGVNETVTLQKSQTKYEISARFEQNVSNVITVYVSTLLTPQGAVSGNLTVIALG